ncbi:hypothetical protein ABZS66_45590 [Dactylosporangium sp. NPDC005572]|uniref:hypothetical protein n=1 Tax=Dactylosporangium sp. NPDC005572 TaxID=3156889 RepID=UPI0033B3777D
MHVLGIGSTGYAIAASSDLLVQRQHADQPTELAQLAGARLVVCSELDEGQRFAESKIKLLTGGDVIPTRFMRGDWFSFKPSHTVVVLGNQRPDVRAGGPGVGGGCASCRSRARYLQNGRIPAFGNACTKRSQPSSPGSSKARSHTCAIV